jgi:PKD repeat protein
MDAAASPDALTSLDAALSRDETKAALWPAWWIRATPDAIGEGPWVVRAYYSDPQLIHDLAAWHEPWDVVPPDHTLPPGSPGAGEGHVILDVTRAEYERLQSAGFRVEIDVEMTAKLQQPNLPLPGQDTGIPGFPCYRTVEETFATAEAIVADYPNLATWVDIGDTWEKMQNPDAGYDLWVLRLTQASIHGPKPKLFIMSSIHAREYTPAELSTRFAEYLVENYNVDPDVTWLLDYHEVQLLLQANPDGRKKAETGLSWRKNTNENYCGPTSDYRGADLNRNFSFQWGCCGGSSSNECDNTYRGPGPASEPETQAMQDYIRTQFPDRREDSLSAIAPLTTTGLFLDVHSFGEWILWSWGFTSTAAPNGDALQTLGRKFGYFNGYYPQQAIELYRTDGTTDDFVYGELGVAAYTFELGTEFFQDCTNFERLILPDNLSALIYAAKVARAPYLLPAGPDVTTVQLSPTIVVSGGSVALSITLDDTRYSQDSDTEPSQAIGGAVYSLDTPPWQGSAITVSLTATDGVFDHKVEGAQAMLDTREVSLGRHTVFVHGYDADGHWGPVSAAFFTVTPGIFPIADFTSNSPVELGSSITFTNLTSGTDPMRYAWDFGDGLGRSTEKNPVYAYSTTGTFTVALVVTNTLGSDKVQHPVTILPYVCDPVSITALHGGPRAWLSQTVHFSASVLGETPLTYMWDFGDATPPLIGVGRKRVTHDYTALDVYTVTLTVTNACPYTDTVSKTLTVYPRPQIKWDRDIYLNGVLNNGRSIDVVDDDLIQTRDRIWVSATIPVTLTLVGTRPKHLLLSHQVNDVGLIQSEDSVFVWKVEKASNNTWYTLTQTFEVLHGIWQTDSITASLGIHDPGLWLENQSVVFAHRYPRIAMRPAAITSCLSSDKTDTPMITISNTGSADLRWNLHAHPDVAWLRLPGGTIYLPGLIPPSSSDVVTFTLDATLSSESPYSIYNTARAVSKTTLHTTTLLLTTNDPFSPAINLPITLTVAHSTHIFLPLILRH